MKPLVIIWIVLFIITLAVLLLFSNKGLKDKFADNAGNKQWRLMGGRINYYRLIIALSMFIAVLLTFLVKFIFKM